MAAKLSRSDNEPGLDGLRGLAALLVFVYHLRWTAGEPKLAFGGIDWQFVFKRFDLGVCLFFVLSGYLLSRPYWEALSSGNWPNLEKYAIRRLARIMPAYWLVLVTIAVLAPGTYSMWGGIALLLQAVGLHTFADYTYLGCVPVLWSIGIEIQYYALLPVLFRMSSWVGRRHVWGSTIALAAIILAIDPAWRLSAGRLVPLLPGHVLPSVQSRVITESIFYFLKWFGLGIAAGGIRRLISPVASQRAFWDAMFLVGVAAFSIVVAFSSEGEWRSVAPWGWPICAVACGLLVFASPLSRIGAWALDNTLLRFFGSISYGIYLWHWPVQKAVFGGTLPARLGSVNAFFVCGMISLFFTCLIAWLSHAAIEAPAIRWARNQRSVRGAVESLLGTSTFQKPVGISASEESLVRASR